VDCCRGRGARDGPGIDPKVDYVVKKLFGSEAADDLDPAGSSKTN
jgi:hypothetical protein